MGMTATQAEAQINYEKRQCHYLAGDFLERANARTLQDDLAKFIHKICFENKLAEGSDK